MAKYEVVIEDQICQGCGYCEKFCYRNCIEMSKKKLTPLGFPTPKIVDLENCTGCGLCSMMCPAYALEVYALAG